MLKKNREKNICRLNYPIHYPNLIVTDGQCNHRVQNIPFNLVECVNRVTLAFCNLLNKVELLE